MNEPSYECEYCNKKLYFDETHDCFIENLVEEFERIKKIVEKLKADSEV